jgi:predicted DNA-binding transcriptional regulator YafY
VPDLRRLVFTYRGRGGAVTTRRVEPHRLVHTGHRWYLVARDLDRDDWRTFRADRIDDPKPTATRFVPRNPPDAAAFVASSVSAAPYRFRAQVILRAPAHVVAERVPPTVGVLEPIDEHTCLLTTGSDSLDLIALHLALLGADFTVVEPPELTEHVRALADRLHRASQ